ncbi:hypothetical protein VTO73DRAFT_11278 [Trametes versicolor]
MSESQLDSPSTITAAEGTLSSTPRANVLSDVAAKNDSNLDTAHPETGVGPHASTNTGGPSMSLDGNANMPNGEGHTAVGFPFMPGGSGTGVHGHMSSEFQGIAPGFSAFSPQPGLNHGPPIYRTCKLPG